MRQAVLLICVLTISGCEPRIGRPLADSQYQKSKELGPDMLDIRAAEMEFAGTKIEVQVSTERRDEEYSIVLSSFGEDLETETYHSTESTFALKEILKETYAPELPLLSFPLKLDSTDNWDGKISIGGIEHVSEAKIKRSRGERMLDGDEVPTVTVEVQLMIDSDKPRPASRTLRFDFVPRKGLLWREFGKELKRSPLVEPKNIGS